MTLSPSQNSSSLAPSTPLSNPLTGLTALALISQLAVMAANKWLPENIRNNAVNFALQAYQFIIGPGAIMLFHWLHDQKARQAIVTAGGDPTPVKPTTTIDTAHLSVAAMLSVILFLGAYAVPTALMLTTSGCAGTAIAPGQDPVAVNAERTFAESLASVDAFVQIDNTNRALFQAQFPKLHAAAESLRKNAPAAFILAHNAIVAYKTASTSTNADAVTTTLQDISILATLANSSLAQYQAGIKSTTQPTTLTVVPVPIELSPAALPSHQI